MVCLKELLTCLLSFVIFTLKLTSTSPKSHIDSLGSELLTLSAAKMTVDLAFNPTPPSKKCGL